MTFVKKNSYNYKQIQKFSQNFFIYIYNNKNLKRQRSISHDMKRKNRTQRLYIQKVKNKNCIFVRMKGESKYKAHIQPFNMFCYTIITEENLVLLLPK